LADLRTKLFVETVTSAILTTLLYTVFLAINAYTLSLRYSDAIRCFSATPCDPQVVTSLRNILFTTAAITICLTLVKIYSTVCKTHSVVAEVQNYNELLSKISKGEVHVVTREIYENFYQKVIEEISNSADQMDILATSSFTPPTKPLQDLYFFNLSKRIIASQANYKVLLAKADGEDWDHLCHEELIARENYLNQAKTEIKGGEWHYGHQFTARRSRYHARMDFIIVGNSVFMNISQSRGLTTNNRGYIYFDDPQISNIFRKWFYAIWNDNEYSDPIKHELDPETGKMKFILK